MPALQSRTWEFKREETHTRPRCANFAGLAKAFVLLIKPTQAVKRTVSSKVQERIEGKQLLWRGNPSGHRVTG